ncbi:MAG: bifunctional ornithine acetyltransferase/N-acetylglutamate synthase [Myxococcales bacterium]|nr:bifunctional ornithine acetyltransferase/N-acetylglutamate synthase [Myxococcales bacterium]
MIDTRAMDPAGVARDGDLFAVPGVRGAAVASGVKPSGDLDLALVVFDEPMTAAGVFTRSATAAPPVRLARAQLREAPSARAVMINSGNANALTGARGMQDARTMRDAAQAASGGPALVLSTGVIGVPLPIERVTAGIERAAAALDASGPGVARAMLTTDTCEKRALARCAAGDAEHVIGGLAKGSGMIHPNMATMLALIATDAPLTPAAARAVLAHAVDRSFHEITVDGDTSTNDAVLLLARTPHADRPPLEGGAIEALQRAVTDVARSLALQVVADGEGATRLMQIHVDGAADRAEALAVASAIGRSPLVKTALAGGDPN